MPSECAYTRFQRRLFDHEQEVQQLFHDAADRLQEVLPDFGQSLAIDGKELHSQANGPVTYAEDDHRQDTPTGGVNRMLIGASRAAARRTRRGTGRSTPGSASVHLGTTYELPVAFEVTEASQPAALRLVDQLEQRHGTLPLEHLSADKGYDDGKLIERLWDTDQAGDRHSQLLARRRDQQGAGTANVIYTFDGEVSCVCPKTGAERSMGYGGFERDRNTLKYRCPARALGIARVWSSVRWARQCGYL